MSFDGLLSGLYVLTGPLLTAAYIPQLIALWHDNTRARALSLLTWATWSLALAITVAYAALVNHDTLFFLTSLCSCIGCIAVFLLACIKRYGLWRLGAQPT